mgnify:CR=1 FL=1
MEVRDLLLVRPGDVTGLAEKLGALLAEGPLPPGWVVTLPKVTIAEQPRTLVRLFETLHGKHGKLPWAALFEPAIPPTFMAAPASNQTVLL